MFYYHIRLCISLAKKWDLFLKTTTHDNFKKSNWIKTKLGLLFGINVLRVSERLTLKRRAVQESLTRNRSVMISSPVKGLIVPLSKKPLPRCLVLDGSKHGFNHELQKLVGLHSN